MIRASDRPTDRPPLGLVSVFLFPFGGGGGLFLLLLFPDGPEGGRASEQAHASAPARFPVRKKGREKGGATAAKGLYSSFLLPFLPSDSPRPWRKEEEVRERGCFLLRPSLCHSRTRTYVCSATWWSRQKQPVPGKSPFPPPPPPHTVHTLRSVCTYTVQGRGDRGFLVVVVGLVSPKDQDKAEPPWISRVRHRRSV